MNIRELSQPITSKILNENMSKQLGYKLNIDKFTTAQLEDARNKLRTEMSQFEVSESFDSVNASPAYQKSRMLHDVINQAILEREEDKDELCEACDCNPCECDDEKDTKKSKQKTEESMDTNIYIAKLATKAQQHSVPNSWIANAIRRINIEESVDQEELSSELQLRYDLSESVANHIVYLSEGEEDEAKIIMSTKDMVDRVTGWLDDVSKMKAEQLLQLLDSIGETKGSDVAAQYGQAVKPALEEIYSALEATRTQLKSAMAIIAGEGGAAMMGAEPGMEPPVPGAEDLGMGGDEMGGMPGEEPMGAEPAGREMRENAAYSRKLGILLAASKKK